MTNKKHHQIETVEKVYAEDFDFDTEIEIVYIASVGNDPKLYNARDIEIVSVCSPERYRYDLSDEQVVALKDYLMDKADWSLQVKFNNGGC